MNGRLRTIGLALVAAVAWAFAPGLHAASTSMNCGGGLVRVGDPVWRVGQRCPEPFWIERWQQPLGFDRFGNPLGFASDTIEVWYLNFGQRRLMRQLVFRNGTLERTRSLGYGVDFVPGSQRCTARQLERAGRTAGEVYARCGAPDYRYDFSSAVGPYYGGPWPPPAGARRERWAYDFGAGRLVRELFFVDGRLIHLAVQPR